MHRAAFLATVVLALGAPVAWADDGASSWPSAATVETDGLVYSAQASADAWWRSQGDDPCPGPAYRFADVGPYAGVAGVGTLRQGACDGTIRYAIGASVVTAARAALVGGLCARPARRLALVSLWMRVAHERGHNAGLLHAPSGVMAPDGAATGPPPPAAWVWVDRLVPASPPALRTTRRHGRPVVVSGCA